MIDTSDLKRVHKVTMRNRKRIEASTRCACFHCLREFEPSEIVEWIEEGRKNTPPGETALCPYCGVDSVLDNSMSERAIAPEFVEAMANFYFKVTRPLADSAQPDDAPDHSPD